MEETFSPVVIDSIGSLYANGPVEKTPTDRASEVRNCKFVGTSARMRFGLTNTAQSQEQKRITGLENFILFGGTPYLLSFNSNGTLEREENQGAGNMATIATGIGTELYADFSQAYEQMFMALSPLTTPAGSVFPKSYYRYNGQFFLDDVGLDPNPAPATGFNFTGTGDVPNGTRYCIILFETRTGYISGCTEASVFTITSDATQPPSQSLSISGLPLGPENCVARWVAFTQAGASSAGPYYIIRTGFTLEELNAPVTSFRVPDNTSSVFTFNFTDDAIVAADPVVTEDIDFFDKVKLVPQKSVFYSPSTSRMVWTGESDTLFRFSEPIDPESYFASTGFVQPGQQDGDFAITAREWRNELYLLKENSGFVVAPTNDHPNVWPVTRRWKGSGPSGPWAVDVAEEFMAFASKAGLYVYDGNAPTNVIVGTMNDVWSRINWNYGHLVWVMIDTDAQEIHVGAPFDQSTLPDKRITLYYGDPPVPMMAAGSNFKWSVDDIAAHKEVRVKRLLVPSPNPQQPINPLIVTRQVLVASSEATGAINMLDPDAYSDNGNPINQRWASAYVAPRKIGIYTLGGVDIMASGLGIIQAYAQPLNTNNPLSIRQISLLGFMTDHSRKTVKQGERFAIIVTNNNQPDSAFTLARITLYMKYMWAVRTT